MCPALPPPAPLPSLVGERARGRGRRRRRRAGNVLPARSLLFLMSGCPEPWLSEEDEHATVSFDLTPSESGYESLIGQAVPRI